MACAKNCSTNNVQLIFDSAGGTFVVTVWDDQDAFITFDDDQAQLNIKRDSLGNIYKGGHDYVIRPFTIQVPCTDEALAIDRAWRSSPISMCGNLELITGCCEDYSFESISLTTVNAPDVGKEIGVYTFSFEGVIKV